MKYIEIENGTTLTNHSSVNEELRSRSKTGNACCHSVCRIFCLPVC